MTLAQIAEVCSGYARVEGDEVVNVVVIRHDPHPITAAAYHAICSKLPEDAPLWPVHRRGRPVASSTSRRPSSTVSRQRGGEERAIRTPFSGSSRQRREHKVARREGARRPCAT